MRASQSMMLQRAGSHMASYGCRFQIKAVRNAGYNALRACCTSTNVCVSDRAAFLGCSQHANPHVARFSCYSSVGLLQECNLTMGTRRASVVSGLRRLACSQLSVRTLRNKPRPAFPCTLSSHGCSAIGHSRKCCSNLSVCRFITMQLGTPAADCMDIAAAPARPLYPCSQQQGCQAAWL